MSLPKILIADDNAQNRELLEAFLARIECDTAFAVDGQDTLNKVESFKPDLILLDVMMPKLNGFEVCRKLKSDKATSKIMILMVTALSELGDIERAVEAGTDDFLSKPRELVRVAETSREHAQIEGYGRRTRAATCLHSRNGRNEVIAIRPQPEGGWLLNHLLAQKIVDRFDFVVLFRREPRFFRFRRIAGGFGEWIQFAEPLRRRLRHLLKGRWFFPRIRVYVGFLGTEHAGHFPFRHPRLLVRT